MKHTLLIITALMLVVGCGKIPPALSPLPDDYEPNWYNPNKEPDVIGVERMIYGVGLGESRNRRLARKKI